MLKELQSLGMDVIVQDKDGNEIDMRQNFDDEETGLICVTLPVPRLWCRRAN